MKSTVAWFAKLGWFAFGLSPIYVCLYIYSYYYFVILNLFGLQTRPALPALQCLLHLNDEEVLTDACWALSYLSDGTNDKIQAVIEAGVCRRLVELLLWVVLCCNYYCYLMQPSWSKWFTLWRLFIWYCSHPSPSVLIPALRTVGNIVTGDDVQTQVWAC